MRLSQVQRIFCLLCFLVALFTTLKCVSTPPLEALPIIIDKNFPLPPKAPAINVKDFGARGDGLTDDTVAIKKAIAATSNAWEQIYFPTGTYLVSDEISWHRFLTLRGAGPRRTVIKLKPNAVGYNSPKNRKAVLFCRMNGKEEAHNNTSHSNHILNLTIDVGSGNRGAVGIDFSSHNGGGIENVIVRASNDSGLIGIAMDRDGPGPALVNHVAVSGFDYGLTTNWGVYSMTFEYIDLDSQRVAGFLSSQHNAVVRFLQSRNRVPAIQLSDGRDYGLFVLLDSNLKGGTPQFSAIQGNGELFVRNVTSSGYRTIVSNSGKTIGGNYLKEYSSSPLQASSGFVNAVSLNLPIENAPYVPWDENFSKWANVQDYKGLSNNGDDWGPAIQAAIDSGKTTVYFPNFTNAPYPIKRDVIVRGSVKRIVGLSAHLYGDHAVIFKNSQPVAVEQIEMPIADFQGTGTVVVKRALGGQLKIRKGAGKVFIEDYCCGNLEMQEGGAVWMRSYNEESLKSPKIRNNGGKLWILGLKTEQSGQVLYNSDGAFTEIIGGLLYPAQGAPTQPMYRNEASAFGAYHREFGSGYPHVLQQKGVIIDPNFAHGVRIVSKAK